MKSSQPLYLARETYRRRRLMDAARLLPLLGVFLLALPVFWNPEQAEQPDTAGEGIYLFIIWAVLIVAAFIFARGLAPVVDERSERRPEAGGAGGSESVGDSG